MSGLFDNKIPLYVDTDVGGDIFFKSKKGEYIMRLKGKPKFILEEMYNEEMEERGDEVVARAKALDRYKKLLNLFKRLEGKEAPFVLYFYNHNHG